MTDPVERAAVTTVLKGMIRTGTLSNDDIAFNLAITRTIQEVGKIPEAT